MEKLISAPSVHFVKLDFNTKNLLFTITFVSKACYNSDNGRPQTIMRACINFIYFIDHNIELNKIQGILYF